MVQFKNMIESQIAQLCQSIELKRALRTISPDDVATANIPRYDISELQYKLLQLTRSLASANLRLEDEIAGRKATEEKLLKTKSYVANVIDLMPSMFIGVNADGNIIHWNKQAEKKTGLSRDVVKGESLAIILPRLASELKRVDIAMKTGNPQHVAQRYWSCGKTGIFEDISIYPLVTDLGKGAVIRIDDVTERVNLEQVMVQTEKMMSVGGLAAGMAHEINNPIAGMMQNANVMAIRLGDRIDMPANLKAAEKAGTTIEAIQSFMKAREIPRMITAINESGRRVSEIVNNMLNFARMSEAQISSYSLPDLLDKAMELAATDFDLKKHYDFKMIEIRKEYDDKAPPVPCEGGKIQQVLLNILRNGAQAMREAGTKKPMFIVRTWFEKERKMVCTGIKDNGPGMDEEVRKRVFEPFYTTKPVGVGTGLGLSVSYFIVVENHGGEISVESTPGSGAQFIIRLPLEGKEQ
jgi:PAS domain S-box-containing protein